MLYAKLFFKGICSFTGLQPIKSIGPMHDKVESGVTCHLVSSWMKSHPGHKLGAATHRPGDLGLVA